MNHRGLAVTKVVVQHHRVARLSQNRCCVGADIASAACEKDVLNLGILESLQLAEAYTRPHLSWYSEPNRMIRKYQTQYATHVAKNARPSSAVSL